MYPDTGYINYDQLEENASLFHPKLIVAGEWQVGSSLVPGQGLCVLQRKMDRYPILQLTVQSSGLETELLCPFKSWTVKSLSSSQTAAIFMRSAVPAFKGPS